jgi:hypothetical protein
MSVTEMYIRTVFIDFVLGLLNMDPIKRWSPQQAKLHPFITGERFNGHWEVRLMSELINDVKLTLFPFSQRKCLATARQTTLDRLRPEVRQTRHLPSLDRKRNMAHSVLMKGQGLRDRMLRRTLIISKFIVVLFRYLF